MASCMSATLSLYAPDATYLAWLLPVLDGPVPYNQNATCVWPCPSCTSYYTASSCLASLSEISENAWHSWNCC